VGRALQYAVLALLIGGTAQAAPRATITPAKLETVLAAIRKPGARAVLVNVWATWCEPCREEMPDLVRAYRAHKAEGLRLVLISSDDEENRAEAEKFLAAQGVDVDSFLKVGDDMAFIDGLDKRWSGALPASFIFDGKGRLLHFWPRQITHDELEAKLTEALKRRTR
jgi:thiol-disulfide isomerase/thioredoxin